MPLKVKDRKLVIAHPRLNEIALTQVKDDNFGFIQFSRNADNDIVSMKIAGENIEFKKINDKN